MLLVDRMMMQKVLESQRVYYPMIDCFGILVENRWFMSSGATCVDEKQLKKSHRSRRWKGSVMNEVNG